MNESAIIIYYRPFSMVQNINVFDNSGNNIYSCVSTTADLNNFIKGLSNDFNINHIILKGNKDFLLKIREELNVTFNNSLMNIDIIE